MKSFTFFMHNIYALGGTVKAVSELANTLADKGHHIEIISVFRAQDEPYFKINDNIKIKTLVDYRLNKYTSLLKPKEINQSEPGLNQFSKYVEHKMIKAIKKVDTDVLVGTRASFNILISKYHSNDVITVGMEHMNLHAHPENYQQDILTAYRNIDLVTTLTQQDQLNYEQQIDTPVYTIPNIINPVKHATKKISLLVQVD